MLLQCAIGNFNCFCTVKVTRNSADGVEVILVRGKAPAGFKVNVSWSSGIIWYRKGYRP